MYTTASQPSDEFHFSLSSTPSPSLSAPRPKSLHRCRPSAMKMKADMWFVSVLLKALNWRIILICLEPFLVLQNPSSSIYCFLCKIPPWLYNFVCVFENMSFNSFSVIISRERIGERWSWRGRWWLLTSFVVGGGGLFQPRFGVAVGGLLHFMSFSFYFPFETKRGKFYTIHFLPIFFLQPNKEKISTFLFIFHLIIFSSFPHPPPTSKQSLKLKPNKLWFLAGRGKND